MTDPKPFTLHVPDADIADLRARLERTRWPDEPPLPPWSTGTSLSYMHTVVDHWLNRFDWRTWEAKLNSFPQFTLPVGGIDLHFIHAPSRKPGAPPLLLMHGWPGSLFEFHKIIPLLTEHFTVIAPSLPGYSLSFKPGQKRFSVEEIAAVFAELMTKLGYQRFGAQGGDWGASIASVMGLRYPDRVTGIHLNLLAMRRDPQNNNPTPAEQKYNAQLAHWSKEQTGYHYIQGTKPQTLSFGLSDSPMGLAAWIVEKFHAWTDHSGTPDSAVSFDEMLADISLYWFTGSIGSSFWPYYARLHGVWPIPPGETVDVPTGYAEFPREILSPPRSIAQKTYTNIQRWTPIPKGGHFAALEQPALLAQDVVAFFAELKTK